MIIGIYDYTFINLLVIIPVYVDYVELTTIIA